MNASLIIFPGQGSQAVQFSNTPPPPNNIYVCGGAFGGPDNFLGSRPPPAQHWDSVNNSNALTHRLPKLALIGIRVIVSLPPATPFCLFLNLFRIKMDNRRHPILQMLLQGLFKKLQLFLPTTPASLSPDVSF